MNLKEIIIQSTKAMLSDDKEPLLFVALLELKDYKNAYKMLSESNKSKYTLEEFKKFVTEDPINENPTPGNFQEEQMPYKKVAIQFATFLVRREYKHAFNMLCKSQQEEYTATSLEKNMNDMTDYFQNNRNIWVAIKFVEEEGAIDDKCIYVPIEEDGNSEAVTVEICLENGKQCIRSIEWGRP